MQLRMALRNLKTIQCFSTIRRVNSPFAPQTTGVPLTSAMRSIESCGTRQMMSRNLACLQNSDVNASYRTSTFVSIALLWVSILGTPIYAQTEAVLVSNWSQSVNATSLVDDERLQTFTTGPDAEGYVLTRVELDFVLPTSVDSFTVNLWTAKGDRPGNRIAILETTQVAVGTPTEFTPKNAVVLQPSTEYFLHIAMKKPDDVVILKSTKSGAEDRSFAATAWQIADRSIHIPDFGSTTWLFEESVLKIRIFGFARLVSE